MTPSKLTMTVMKQARIGSFPIYTITNNLIRTTTAIQTLRRRRFSSGIPASINQLLFNSTPIHGFASSGSFMVEIT